MAQFRGTVLGSRKVASRLGTKSSGLTVTARGWNVGVTVEVVNEGGRDLVFVYSDGGTNGGDKRLIATLSEGGYSVFNGPEWVNINNKKEAA